MTPTLPEALKARRAEIGRAENPSGRPISQEEASVRMGQSKNQCQRWEAGQRSEAIDKIEALMTFLDLSQDELAAVMLETELRPQREARARR